MTSTLVPPSARGTLAVGKVVGRHLHMHVLGLAIIRDQLVDGDEMFEDATGQRVVRMRTELVKPVAPVAGFVRTVPMPRISPDDIPTGKMPLAYPIVEPTTVRIITGRHRAQKGPRR